MVQTSGSPTTLECAHFVDAVDDELMCPICRRIVVSPVQCKEGHVFCKGCIETALCQKEECPMDRSALRLADLSPVLAVEQAVNRKRVRCPHAAQHTDEEGGCDWVGKVSERQKHINTECGYTSVPCPHDGCEVRVQRRAVEKHAASCEQRAEACEHCGEGVAVSQGVQHEQVCPQVSVECAFKDVGCTAPSMLRKDVSAHEAETAGTHATLALAAQKEARERERALEAAASALRTEAEEATRLQAAEKKAVAAHHAEEKQVLVERATKAEDRCKNIVFTDMWVIESVEDVVKNNSSCTHKVSLSQDRGAPRDAVIRAVGRKEGTQRPVVRCTGRTGLSSGPGVTLTVEGALCSPHISVMLHNACPFAQPRVLADESSVLTPLAGGTARAVSFVTLAALRQGYITGSGSVTLVITVTTS